MALTWVEFRCQQCRRTVMLPQCWEACRHSRSLRCLDCHGVLTLVKRTPQPRRVRKST